jgi:acyl-CoA thioester hydrolase
MSDQFEQCKVSIDTPVAWGEMDAFQHVNNTVYFKYFESARIAYFDEVGVNDEMKRSNIGPILASTQCRFKAPLTYPDNISIATRVTEISDDRFTMKYYVKSHNSGRIAAEGEGLIVFYDYNNNCKHAIPEQLKERIMELESL